MKKIKFYFMVTVMGYLLIGLVTSCSKEEKNFTLSKDNVEVGINQVINVEIKGLSTYQAIVDKEDIATVSVKDNNVMIKGMKKGDAVVKVVDTHNIAFIKEIKVKVLEGAVVTKNTVTLNTSAGDKWVYFSFLKGQVMVNDSSVTGIPEGLEWDIAFCRNFTRTNSGTSNSKGEGKGGAVMTNFKNLDEVTAIPESSLFVIDTIGLILPKMKDIVTSCNEELYKWAPLDLESGTMPPPVTLSKNVFVVRCADGKTYAKIKFLAFTDNESNRFYPKFEYVYPFK